MAGMLFKVSESVASKKRSEDRRLGFQYIHLDTMAVPHIWASSDAGSAEDGILSRWQMVE